MTPLTGTGVLTRLALRRDRLQLCGWWLLLGGLMTVVALKFGDLYGTATERLSITATLKTPAMVALLGSFPSHGPRTVAVIFANEMLLFMALAQIGMNLTLAIRATRLEEDQGITELLRAHGIAPRAPLTAAALELTITNLVLGFLYAVGLSVAHMPGATSTGNWLIGGGLAAIGWLFGMFALLFAQLTDHATSATGLAYTFLGLSYLSRMFTDLQYPRLTWWSPLGWVEKLSPYTHPHGLPLGLSLLGGGLLFALTLRLNQRRDLGAGLLTTRPGARRASRFLQGPTGLLWRRNRNRILGWVVAVSLLGATYGSIFNTIGNILKTNPTMQQVFGKALVHSANHQLISGFAALILLVLATAAIIPGLQLLFALFTDERHGWLESLFASPIRRTHLLLSYLGVALISSVGTFFGGWLGLIVVGDASLTHVSDGLSADEFWQGLAGMLPAIVLFLALGTLLIGWWPQGRSLVWLYLIYGFVSQYLGGLLKLPQWAKRLTPLGWQPSLPTHCVDWFSVGLTLALTVGIGLVGWWGYTQRDFELN